MDKKKDFMELSQLERFKRQYSDTDFLREVLINLAKDGGTPTDILESSFDAVKPLEREYLVVKGDVDLTYTCSIGYDRQEEYYEQVRKRDSSGNYYYVKEKKTRTVTDWQPYSGSKSSTQTVLVFNEPMAEEHDKVSEVFKQIECVKKALSACKGKELSVFEEKKVSVDSGAIQWAKRECAADCFYSIRLPGDRTKDSNYSGDVEVTGVQAFTFPEYELTYKYGDKAYIAKGFASGDMQMKMEKPSVEADIDKEAAAAVRPLKVLAILVLIGGVVLNLLMTFIGWWCILGYAAAIVLFIVHSNAKSKKRCSIGSEMKAKKKESLIKMLKEKGLNPLTNEELTSF